MLADLEAFVREWGPRLGPDFEQVAPGVWVVAGDGCVLGPGAAVYPLVGVRGTVPPDTIVKTADPAGWVRRF